MIERPNGVVTIVRSELETASETPLTEPEQIINELYSKVKNLGIHSVVGRSEQLVSFLRQYQKACEIMHVNKIDAKNFVEQYKTNY